tara:strand:- start:1420 stop:1719 length:300 start_codon:yes stop_codon:yes gene_type:complete
VSINLGLGEFYVSGIIPLYLAKIIALTFAIQNSGFLARSNDYLIVSLAMEWGNPIYSKASEASSILADGHSVLRGRLLVTNLLFGDTSVSRNNQFVNSK